MYINENGKIWLATGKERVYLEPSMCNRHGLIAGATGTGKTVTLKVIAESFSDMGVPVFMADIKGDLTGMCKAGVENKHILRSIETMNIENFTYGSYPARFFDVYAREGHPVRTTMSEMGPELLARLLDLNDIQSGVLRIIFRIADDNGLLLLDIKDLKSMIQFVGDNANEFKLTYGNVSTASLGAIQRALLKLEDDGGEIFFGEPALELEDWFDWDEQGRGVMNILECKELFQHPLLYSTFLLWMLSELYEMLPEVGDIDKPKIAFFFDEAHLLFNDAPKALIEKIEQVIRLIRSKGVSVWFITQNPADVPESVLGQIGNRVQHALRAYTPNEQKALRYAAKSFRVNPDFDTETVLQELATGEALVSVLDEKGVPTVVERAGILPPRSSMSIADDSDVQQAIFTSPLRDKYMVIVDRESAYELLMSKFEAQQAAEEEAKAQLDAEKEELEKQKQETALEKERAKLEKEREKLEKEKEKLANKKRSSYGYSSSRRRTTSPVRKTINSAANTVGRELGKQLIRGIFGTLK